MPKKYVLSSGLRLVVEQMPHLRSVASGIWVNCGSVYEDKVTGGVSHFLEHMLFKGTAKRSPLDIAMEMEAVGGVLNAFTGKEHTCYYARSLDEHFALGLDLLADMYCNSRLGEEDFAREKKVILEEINMSEDSPDDVVMDRFVATIYPDHAYGPPIAGTPESVGNLSRDQLWNHYQKFYTPANSVLAIAGNIEPEYAVEMAEKAFAKTRSGGIAPELSIPVAKSGMSSTSKDIEQTHVCLGFPAVPLDHKDYYAAAIISNTLGGGASSRLFQEVREKRGLAYSAYCYLEAYVKSGFIIAYAATNPANGEELLRIMAEQFADILQHGITEEEIKRSKDQLKGSLLLGLESTSNVMSKIGRTELALNRDYDAELTAAKVMAVTPDDIERVIKQLIVPEKLVMSQVGPKKIELSAKDLF